MVRQCVCAAVVIMVNSLAYLIFNFLDLVNDVHDVSLRCGRIVYV